jgi:hypothetical protein
MSLGFYEKGVYVTMASLLRTQQMDVPGKFVINGRHLTIQEIQRLLKTYGSHFDFYAEPADESSTPLGTGVIHLRDAYGVPGSEPKEQPKSAKSRATAEGMKLFHAVRKINQLGLLRQDDNGAYYSPEVVKNIEESEMAARSSEYRKRQNGHRSGARPGDLENGENKKEGTGDQEDSQEERKGTPIDELPETFQETVKKEGESF